jgi:hypothetical protein
VKFLFFSVKTKKLIKKLRKLNEDPEFHLQIDVCLFADFLADRIEQIEFLFKEIDPKTFVHIASNAAIHLMEKKDFMGYPQDAFPPFPYDISSHPLAGEKHRIQSIMRTPFLKMIDAIFPWWLARKAKRTYRDELMFEVAFKRR